MLVKVKNERGVIDQVISEWQKMGGLSVLASGGKSCNQRSGNQPT